MLGGKSKVGTGNMFPAFKTYKVWYDKSTISERSSTKKASHEASHASLEAVVTNSMLMTSQGTGGEEHG
jgi:hypothetical protein